MLSLLDRLKAEYRVKLDASLETTPITTAVLYRELRDKLFFTELPYEFIHYLAEKLNIGYAPREISELFYSYEEMLGENSYNGLIKSMQKHNDHILNNATINRRE